MASKRITVYPSPLSLRILGDSSPALNQAVDCWAIAIQRAAADNAKLLTREDWCLLADVNNGTMWEPGDTSPASGLRAQVEDGDRLDGLGKKWYTKNAREQVRELAATVGGMDYIHAWAIVTVCQRFWDRHDTINMRTDEWWIL